MLDPRHSPEEVEKTARLVRVHNARIEQEQSATMARAAAALILHETRDLFERFAGMSKEVARYLRRVRQALTDDWQDFFEPEPSRPGEPDVVYTPRMPVTVKGKIEWGKGESQAVDLTLAHGHRPAVYRWDADRVARAA